MRSMMDMVRKVKKSKKRAHFFGFFIRSDEVDAFLIKKIMLIDMCTLDVQHVIIVVSSVFISFKRV